MKTKSKLILIGSLSLASGAFYYTQKIKLASGEEIHQAKRIIGGALIGAMVACSLIVGIEFYKNK